MRPSSAQPCQSDQADIFVALGEFATLSARQMASVAQASEPLVQAYLGLLRTAMMLPMTTLSSISPSIKPSGPFFPAGCEIPETACPPRCVCEITWDSAPGQHVIATIALTNTRNQPQTFNFKAEPFRGPAGTTAASVLLSPASVTLGPDESATVTVAFDVPATFAAGDVYSADVTIAGLYEQCVRLTLRVRRVPHCDVKQGEIPRRIRAHRWYDHFQCEELCFEPIVTRQPSTDQTMPSGE